MPLGKEEEIGIEPIEPAEITYTKLIEVDENSRSLTVKRTPSEPIVESTIYDYNSLFNVMDQEINAILSWFDKIKADAIQPILDGQAEYAELNGDVDLSIQNQLVEKLNKLTPFYDFITEL